MDMNYGDRQEQHVVLVAATGLSFATGFFFSFRLFILVLAVRFFGADDQTGVEVGLVLNFLMLVLVAFQSIGCDVSEDIKIWRLSAVRWVVLFLCFSGCSLLWTVSANFSAAIVFWCAMAADVAMVVLLFRVGPIDEVASALMKGFVWGACAVAIIAWLMPARSDLRLGDDELLGPNQIGYLCAFALFPLQYLIRLKQGKWGISAFILAVTLLRSLSKTSILAFLVAEAFLLVNDKSISRKTKARLILAAMVIATAFASLLSSYFDVYTSAGNSPETLTGRIGIWGFILNEAIQSPWIGHGFHSVWKVIPPFGEFEARHAHNELIQQFYSYGAVGICLMLGLYGSVFLQIRRLVPGPLKTLYYAMLFFVLIRGLTDTETFDLSLPLWAIVMFSLLMEKACAAARQPLPGLDLEEIRLARLANAAPADS